jgi:hypothetical protein
MKADKWMASVRPEQWVALCEMLWAGCSCTVVPGGLWTPRAIALSEAGDIPNPTKAHHSCLPLGSARRPPQQLQRQQHSSEETCCVNWHRRHRGWSARRSCQHGGPSQREQGTGRALPGASSNQLLQGNTSLIWLDQPTKSKSTSNSTVIG